MNEEETMDDTWWETFDSDAAYYQEDYEEQEFEFDPGEYDEAYASYVDARKRFNDLKLSRGFLPVVALQDAPSSSSTPSQRPFKGLGKGKKEKGKGKGKSSTYRYDKAPAKQSVRSKRKRSRCLGCRLHALWINLSQDSAMHSASNSEAINYLFRQTPSSGKHGHPDRRDLTGYVGRCCRP